MPSPDCSCIAAGFGVNPCGDKFSVPHGLLSAGHPGYKNDKEARVSPKTGGRSIRSEGPTPIWPGQYRITPHRHSLCRMKKQKALPLFAPCAATARPYRRQAAYRPGRYKNIRTTRALARQPYRRQPETGGSHPIAPARPCTPGNPTGFTQPDVMPSRPPRQERER